MSRPVDRDSNIIYTPETTNGPFGASLTNCPPSEMNAAVYQLNQWVVNGTAPPIGALMQTTGTSPVVFAYDANGNVLGGVRSPQVDAPIAALGGVGNSGSGALGTFCRLFGTTVPFTSSQLAALYKNHGAFVSQWDQATQSGVNGGFLLQRDAKELKRAAARSQIGRR